MIAITMYYQLEGSMLDISKKNFHPGTIALPDGRRSKRGILGTAVADSNHARGTLKMSRSIAPTDCCFTFSSCFVSLLL